MTISYLHMMFRDSVSAVWEGESASVPWARRTTYLCLPTQGNIRKSTRHLENNARPWTFPISVPGFGRINDKPCCRELLSGILYVFPGISRMQNWGFLRNWRLISEILWISYMQTTGRGKASVQTAGAGLKFCFLPVGITFGIGLEGDVEGCPWHMHWWSVPVVRLYREPSAIRFKLKVYCSEPLATTLECKWVDSFCT